MREINTIQFHHASQCLCGGSAFATLDPTLRRLQIQDVGTAILADTVGFVRQLPHDLVSAFKSTLQETVEASLLLHVIDAADARKIENIEAVNLVLEEIKADKVPVLLVYNKIDLLENMAPILNMMTRISPLPFTFQHIQVKD